MKLQQICLIGWMGLLCLSCTVDPPNAQQSLPQTSISPKMSLSQPPSSPAASDEKSPISSVIQAMPSATQSSPLPSACPFAEQEKATLRGQVLDKLTQEPLQGATVILRLGDQTNSPSLCPAGAFLAQVSTSATGSYELSAPVGFEINLVVSQVGYYPYKRIEVVNGRVGPTINVFDFYLTSSESEGFVVDSNVPKSVFGAD